MESNSHIVSTKKLALLFGVSERQIQRLVKAEIIDPLENSKTTYRFNEAAATSQYIQYLSLIAAEREKTDGLKILEVAKLEAEVKFKQTKSEVAKLELSELQARMHDAEDVEAIMTDHVLYFRSLLMGMPGKLAMDLSNLHTAPEMAERVKQEVYFVLNCLADYQYPQGSIENAEKPHIV